MCKLVLVFTVWWLSVKGDVDWLVKPSDVCYQENETATLTCALSGMEDTLHKPGWSQRTPKDRVVSTGTVVDRDKCNTCNITGNHTAGHYDLTIDPLSPPDFGTWRCTHIEAENDSYEARVVQPTPCTGATIHINGGEHQSGEVYVIKENSILHLRCNPFGCHPPCVEIVWYNDSREIPDSRSTTNGVTVVVSKEDNDRIFACKVGNSVTPGDQRAYIKLNVVYAPHNTRISGVKLSCPTELTCSTEGNPEPSIYWPSVDKYNKTIDIHPFEDTNVSCVATNDHGAETSQYITFTGCEMSTSPGTTEKHLSFPMCWLLSILWLTVL